MHRTQFSVSINVYNGDNPIFFKEAVRSLLQQTLIPDEIVLVVDGPINKTLNDVVSKYQKNKIFKIIHLKKNMGHGEARRVGIENCTFDLIAIMDADDICRKNRFEKQIKVFDSNKEISVLGGNIEEFEDSIDNIVSIKEVPNSHDEIVDFAKRRCPMNQMTVMFRKSNVLDSGGYLDWHCNEDYYLWIRMIKNKFIFKNLNDILVSVRVSKDMYSRRGGIKYFLSESKLQIYMYRENMINTIILVQNIFIRFFVQLLLPNSLRRLFFINFARTKKV